MKTISRWDRKRRLRKGLNVEKRAPLYAFTFVRIDGRRRMAVGPLSAFRAYGVEPTHALHWTKGWRRA